MRHMLALFALLTTPFAYAEVPVQPFVPESGFYWNPDQDGRGYAFEIQDRTLFVTAYVYTEEGNPSRRIPLWYSTAGQVVEGRLGSSVVYRYSGELFYSAEGQCLGCAYVPPVTENTGRPIDITFESPVLATMVIDGERIELERFWFTPSISDPIFAMFGQWMIVTDFTDVDGGVLPFDGDLLEIGFEGSSGGEAVAEGFRGGTAITVAGAYNPDNDFFVIVVAERSNEFLAYYFPGSQFGTDSFYGLAERYTPGDGLTFLGFPMQGYRVSDRTHTEQVLSAKRAGPSAAPRSQRPRSKLADGEPVIPIEGINEMVRMLENRLAEAKARPE